MSSYRLTATVLDHRDVVDWHHGPGAVLKHPEALGAGVKVRLVWRMTVEVLLRGSLDSLVDPADVVSVMVDIVVEGAISNLGDEAAFPFGRYGRNGGCTV